MIDDLAYAQNSPFIHSFIHSFMMFISLTVVMELKDC